MPIVIDQTKIDAPAFPRSQEWWTAFVPVWVTAAIQPDSTVLLEPNGRQMGGDGVAVNGQLSAAGWRRREMALVRWVHNMPRLAVASQAAEAVGGQRWPVREIGVLTVLGTLDRAAPLPNASAHWFTADDLLGQLPAGDYTRAALADTLRGLVRKGLAKSKTVARMPRARTYYMITPAGKGRCLSDV